MAMKLSIGFQKKLGLPDYGSAGAHCEVEFEIDHSLLDSNLEGFHEKAQRAFTACQQAVNDQLARQTQNGSAKNGTGHSNGQTSAGNGHSPKNGLANGNGHAGNSPRMATQSQTRAIRAIASKQQLDLQQILQARFGVNRPENLRLSDASTLIDELINPSDDNGGRR